MVLLLILLLLILTGEHDDDEDNDDDGRGGDADDGANSIVHRAVATIVPRRTKAGSVAGYWRGGEPGISLIADAHVRPLF